MAATSFQLSSARLSRAGKRVLAIANFSLDSIMLTEAETETKDCFGATPKPARETRALPGGVNR
jgi:hypothetical protein